MHIHSRQPVAFFNARLIKISSEDSGSNFLVFEYQGQEKRQPTFSGTTEYLAQHIGKFGVVMRTDWETQDRDFPEYRFQAYIDQSLRRAFELDMIDHIVPIGSPNYNTERIGWRNDLCPDGFLAPAGIIPGEHGRFVEDETVGLTIDVPPEFTKLCSEFKATPMQVLRGFIADSAALHSYASEPRADGYSSKGSDERMMAYDYIERAYGMWRDDDN